MYRALLKILAGYETDWGMDNMCEYWKTTLQATVAVQMRDDGCPDDSGGTGERNPWS